MDEDPEFKRQVEEEMRKLNIKYGVDEGDMHGIEDDLDLENEVAGKHLENFDPEKDEIDMEQFRREMKEEIAKIN